MLPVRMDMAKKSAIAPSADAARTVPARGQRFEA